MPPLATFLLLARPRQSYKPTHADSLLARASFGPANGVHFRFQIDGEERGRTDIWVEAPKGVPRGVLLLEMKVHMAVSKEQLGRYERALDARLSQLGLPRESAIKVLLTYELEVPGQYPGWFVVGWQKMAAHLAPPCIDPSSGGAFLKFYLATILREIQMEPCTLKQKIRLRNLLRIARESPR